VFQAWFDDSGKEGANQSPVYLLAGYSARTRVWEDFADDWQTELNRPPRLRWLHATVAYNLKGEFGYDKNRGPSEWTSFHGRGNKKARDERLLRFAQIITKHLHPQTDSHGITWVLQHVEYTAFLDQLSKVVVANKADLEELKRVKNPYYLSFQRVLIHEHTLRAASGIATGVREKTEIFFDEGIDNKDNLEEGFKQFMSAAAQEAPQILPFFQNKKPEYRDDKDKSPLQAADLLAWHVRRLCRDVFRGAKQYNDPVWRELYGQKKIKYWDFRYTASHWNKILVDIRAQQLRSFGIWLPPIR
jgi:Protein of unknown function (DUF3800)